MAEYVLTFLYYCPVWIFLLSVIMAIVVILIVHYMILKILYKRPRPVSRKSAGSASPISPIASMTSSTGMRLVMPATAMFAALTALTAPMTLRLTHGTSTSPATGSQTSPSRTEVGNKHNFKNYKKV